MRRELDALLSMQRFFAGVLPEPWDVRTELEAGEPPQRPFALVEQTAGAETSGAPAMQDVTVPLTANLYLARGESREAATEAALVLREDVWKAVKWGPDAKQPTTDRIPLYSYLPRVERHRFAVVATGGSWRALVGAAETFPLAPDVSAADLASAIEQALADADDLAVLPGDVIGFDRGRGLWDVHYAGGLSGLRPGAPSTDDTDLTGPGAGAAAMTLLEGAPAPWRAPRDYMRVMSFSQNTVRDEDDPAMAMVAVDLRVTFARGPRARTDYRLIQRLNGASRASLEDTGVRVRVETRDPVGSDPAGFWLNITTGELFRIQ